MNRPPKPKPRSVELPPRSCDHCHRSTPRNGGDYVKTSKFTQVWLCFSCMKPCQKGKDHEKAA